MRHVLLSRMAVLQSLIVLTAVGASAVVKADATSGGVNWLDPLAYTKPRFYPLQLPSDASVPNKYYVDMTAGSGTACTQAAPCASIAAVSGKPGTSGGPAIIYLKGNGRLNVTSGTLAGSVGSEIVVKPWPTSSTPAVMTATGGCGTGDANTVQGSGVHHVVFDGGPDMLFRFVGSGCTSNQGGYTLIVNSNDVTMTRVRLDANDSSGPALGVSTGSGMKTARFRWINSELFNANRYYGVYTGGGTGCAAGDTTHTDIEFRNSIFRQIDGRGIQIEPRADSSGVIIDGNAFHDVGYNKSGNNNGISGAVQPAAACGGETRNLLVSNNLMFDLAGAGVILNIDGSSSVRVINNTIFDYAKNTVGDQANSYGITCYVSTACTAEVRNNIILKKNISAVAAMRNTSNWFTNDNICESSDNCGSGKITGTVSTIFTAATPDSQSFLLPKGEAIGSATVQAGVEADYRGLTRTTGTDVGAISSNGLVQSMPPANLQAQ